MRLILRAALLVAAILGAAHYLPQVHVKDFGTAVILVVVLGLLNVILKPVLVFFTIPVTILTFGLFLLVINTIIVLVADWLIQGFYIDSYLWSFIFALLLSLFNFLIDQIIKKE